MASLFSKVQTLISANLHALVDKALKANSVAVLDEYIRQAEDNLDDLQDALITVRGQVKTLERKWKIFQAEAEPSVACRQRRFGDGGAEQIQFQN